jgi:uncharacterized protein (DUF2236 family)
VLLIFAGCAAEFALNRAVDWLFFTGKLPADPIGRLFSTAGYAQQIVFADESTATRAFERIRDAHERVEERRGATIPAWAHRDVLYMLIEYSERAHTLLSRPLTEPEQSDLYDVFRRVGTGLGIPDLPPAYPIWRADREAHMQRDLACSEATKELYAQYRRHLGSWRYRLLLRVQATLCPSYVRTLLGIEHRIGLELPLRLYGAFVRRSLRALIHRAFLPRRVCESIPALEHAEAS